MAPAQGTAWRVQFEAAYTVLAEQEAEARRLNDQPTLRLIRAVRLARDAARRIENRGRGVSLVKVKQT